jgi:hypothetical protein
MATGQSPSPQKRDLDVTRLRMALALMQHEYIPCWVRLPRLPPRLEETPTRCSGSPMSCGSVGSYPPRTRIAAPIAAATDRAVSQ